MGWARWLVGTNYSSSGVREVDAMKNLSPFPPRQFSVRSSTVQQVAGGFVFGILLFCAFIAGHWSYPLGFRFTFSPPYELIRIYPDGQEVR